MRFETSTQTKNLQIEFVEPEFPKKVGHLKFKAITPGRHAVKKEFEVRPMQMVAFQDGVDEIKRCLSKFADECTLAVQKEKAA